MIAVALTNVWTKNHQGEWVRTTAEVESSNYRYHVSANLRHFRCYSCFHYVEYYPESSTQCCHFRHSRRDIDKDCEDRSTSSAYSTIPSTWDSPAPMRLHVNSYQPELAIGFLPIDQVKLKQLASESAAWILKGACGSPMVYRIDASRFTPHETTWLPIRIEWAMSIQASFRAKTPCPIQWNRPIRPATPRGAVFDCITGRKVEDRGDVEVGREYWLLGSNSYIGSNDDVRINRVTSGSRWHLFRIKTLQYSESASNFFFEKLHLRLTNRPANINALWPPMIETDDMLETNCQRLWLLVEGESDLEVYPCWSRPILNKLTIDAQTHLYELSHDNSLQLVSAERFSKKLKCLYLRSLEDIPDHTSPELLVTDDNHKLLSDDVLKVLPVNGILSILSEVDGFVDVSDEDGLIYRQEISAGEELRLTALTCGNTLTLFQGLDAVRTIAIPRPEKRNVSSISLPEWRGYPVPFPRRYAGILAQVDRGSELYTRIQIALSKGTIRADGLKYLQQMMEG